MFKLCFIMDLYFYMKFIMKFLRDIQLIGGKEYPLMQLKIVGNRS